MIFSRRKVFLIPARIALSQRAKQTASDVSTITIIFAAHNGTLKVKQNGELTAAAAETLYLENNATVTYNHKAS